MWAEGEGDSRALTFVARDQRPAFGLEVGRDDVTEAVGQDVVGFIVDVLPAMRTGLKDGEGLRAEQEVPGGTNHTPACQVVLWGQRDQEAFFSPTQPHPGPGAAPGLSQLVNKKKPLGGHWEWTRNKYMDERGL